MARPVRPEAKFFIDNVKFERGYDWYHQTYFDKPLPGLKFGEKSTSYIEHELAAQRISSYNPAAKLLVALRDPVQRALSNYHFSVENGLETLGINEAILTEETRIAQYQDRRVSVCPFAYATRGRYMNYLETYLKYFPANQIELIQTENLAAGAAGNTIFKYLGLEAYAPSPPEEVNASRKIPVSLNNKAIDWLENYFSESNQRLADRFDIDLALWPCKVA